MADDDYKPVAGDRVLFYDVGKFEPSEGEVRRRLRPLSCGPVDPPSFSCRRR